MISTLVSGFILGFSLSVYCSSTCTPIMVPLVATSHRGTKNGFFAGFAICFGRLVAYLLYAVIIGFMGKLFLADVQKSFFINPFLASLFIAYGFFLSFGRRLWPKKVHSACSRFGFGKSSMAIGVLIGLSPCLPLIVALTYSFTLDLALGIFFIVHFWLGSSILLILIVGATGYISNFIRNQEKIERIRRICGGILLIQGIIFLSNFTQFFVSNLLG